MTYGNNFTLVRGILEIFTFDVGPDVLEGLLARHSRLTSYHTRQRWRDTIQRLQFSDPWRHVY